MYRLYQSSPLSSHPVVALAELSGLCAGACADERTFYLLLLQLQREKRVTVLEQNGEKVPGRGPEPGAACACWGSAGSWLCADLSPSPRS